jgi:hypothetical protein
MSSKLGKPLTDVITEDLSPFNNSLNGIDETNTFLSLSWQTWIIIILILALFGINIFLYLAKGTEELTNILNNIVSFFSPIFKWFGFTTLETTKQTIETGAIGTKAGVDIISGAITSVIDTAQQQIDQSRYEEINIDNIPLQQTIDSSQQISTEEVSPDDSQSPIQANKPKRGWCFIGEENGLRVCTEIDEDDICMSEQIFPTNELCINPPN